MASESDLVNTTLCLGNVSSTTHPSTSNNRNRKKPRKQSHPVSTLTNPISRSIKSKLQPGCLIHLDKRTELYQMFAKSNWEPILFYPNRKVLPNMVTEFYNNMDVRHGVGETVFVTSVVNGKALLLDHIELCKALKLSLKLLNLANIDISKEFTFNKMELKLYLSVFCEVEVPHNLFVEDKGVSYEHFSPIFQNLALIMRGNIYPNTTPDKLMSFAEIKLMYKLASQKVTFNISYVILLQMINGFKKGYMLYGLLLTKVFEYFKLNINQLPYFQVASTISDRVVRTVIPLPGFSGPPPPLVVVPVNDDAVVPVILIPADEVSLSELETKLLSLEKSHTELEALLMSLQEQFKALSEKFQLTETKIGVLVEILSNSVTREGKVDDGLSQMINVQLGLLDIPFLPLVEEPHDDMPVMAAGNVGPEDEVGGSNMETDGASDKLPEISGFDLIDE